jgi:hypothetical protein
MTDILSDKLARLNSPQASAVEAIIEGWDSPTGEFVFPIVDGPPGTGKTEVGTIAVARYAREFGKSQSAYLCYTHFAADRALESFVEMGFLPSEVIRVVDSGKTTAYSRSPLKDYYVFAQGDRTSENDERRLRNAPILVGTLYGSSKIFKFRRRPLMVIDEFSQVSPPLFFSALSAVNSNKNNPTGYALLGDPNQLPVISSQEFLRPNIGVFVCSRNDYLPHELDTQYRMHPDICQAVNALRYALNTYPLKTHESAESKTLTALGYDWREDDCVESFREILKPKNTFVMINTDALPGSEMTGLDGSKYYQSEAALAARISVAAHESYVNVKSGGLVPTILSPYNAQVNLVRDLLPSELRGACMTIYKSQGREYPCVLISLARKNEAQSIGFLGEPDLRAQAYVACSRAKAKLIVLFSFSTFRGHREYDILLDRCGNAFVVDADRIWGESV